MISTIATIASVLLHFFPTTSTGILLESQWGCPHDFCLQTTGKKQGALLVPRLLTTVDEWRSTLSAAACPALVFMLPSWQRPQTCRAPLPGLAELHSEASLCRALGLENWRPSEGQLCWQLSSESVWGENKNNPHNFSQGSGGNAVCLSLMAEHRGTTAA